MAALELFRNRKPSGVPGRLFGSVFLFFFLGMGLLFASFIGREVMQRVKTYRWPAVPCTIRSSSVFTDSSSENPYRFAVRYEYQVGGQKYQSERAALSDVRSGDYSKALRLVEKFPAGSQAICYANPNNPNEAILQRSSLWFALLLVFPLPFILIGGGGIAAMWSKPRANPVQALSTQAKPRTNAGCVALFFSIFLLAGLACLIVFFVRPMLKVQQARSWPAIPCTVISSQLRSDRGDDGTTYSVDILYRYTVNGKEYKANRYSFLGSSSSGTDRKAAIVARHRPGTQAICYVNPNSPSEAVLERNMTLDMWFGLIPAIFVAVGVAGLVHSFRLRRRANFSVPRMASALRRESPKGSERFQTADISGPVVLKPRASPLAKFVGALFIALFWNGIISVFLVQVIHGWQRGRAEWFLAIFLIPFVLVGLGLLVFVAYTFLALFSPRVRLTATASSVLPGAAIQLTWATAGQVRKVRSLRVYLEGREEATYTRGTRSTTDTVAFATIPIAEVNDPSRIAAGAAELTIPVDAIHSFKSEHNKIVWALFVKADVLHMPDVKDEFEINVLPQPVAPPIKP